MMNSKRSHAGLTSTDIIFIVIALVLVGGFAAWLLFRPPPPVKSNREVAMSCTLDMYTQFHIHPQLEIIIDGKKQELPTNIGIIAGCMHPLHTHDSSGEIHVESPEKRDFTLGDFFAVWGKPFSADDAHVVRQTVNGAESVDFENTVLHDKDKIVISYEKKK